MTFAEHLKKGIEKARSAREANDRISAILTEFRREVGGGLTHQSGSNEDRAPVQIAEHRNLKVSWATSTDEFIAHVDGERRLVFLVIRSVDGFPVQLLYADQLVWCRTEDELRSALGEMLENAKIAEWLKPQDVAANG
jgi:hypothetical protein